MSNQMVTAKNNITAELRLVNGKSIDFSTPQILGVLNLTPDSFSDGGKWTSQNSAVDFALNMIEDGADIIDIGGESSRPGASPVPQDEEIKRVIPVIETIRKETDTPISIDTYKSGTAKRAIDCGVDIVNDISALKFSDDMANLVAQSNVPIIMMHMLGTPQEMQKNPQYNNVTEEIISFFEERIQFAKSKDIDENKIIIDPGIGFGKSLEHNLTILKNLDKFKKLNHPLLIGTSRKSFIQKVHDKEKPAENRIGGSIASIVIALLNGADFIRVHDVEETVEAVKIVQAIRSA